jgi:hypothetical protein
MGDAMAGWGKAITEGFEQLKEAASGANPTTIS